jgi:hypothetical protein
MDPPLDGGLSFRIKEGSSQWWLALLVDNHGNALRSVEVSSDGSSWSALARSDYNYWIAQSGAGPGPFSVRVTDVRGHVAVAPGIEIRPGQVQQTTVRLYGSAGGGGGGGGGGGSPTSSPTTTATTSATTTSTIPWWSPQGQDRRKKHPRKAV